jgi:BlaI family penicillinase repressor
MVVRALKEIDMARKLSELTAGEWAIMQAVWDNEPCAAPTIQEALEKEIGWSYSTVKTMMDRMAAKGLLWTQRIRNLILYSSAITKKEAQKGEVMRTVRRAFDGAMTPMMQFLLDSRSLSSEELEQLEQMIKDKKEKAEKKN